MKIQRVLDTVIGALLLVLVILSGQLAILYLQPGESLAQSDQKYSHPLINGQPVLDMPDADCMACHQHLP